MKTNNNNNVSNDSDSVNSEIEKNQQENNQQQNDNQSQVYSNVDVQAIEPKKISFNKIKIISIICGIFVIAFAIIFIFKPKGGLNSLSKKTIDLKDYITVNDNSTEYNGYGTFSYEVDYDKFNKDIGLTKNSYIQFKKNLLKKTLENLESSSPQKKIKLEHEYGRYTDEVLEKKFASGYDEFVKNNTNVFSFRVDNKNLKSKSNNNKITNLSNGDVITLIAQSSFENKDVITFDDVANLLNINIKDAMIDYTISNLGDVSNVEISDMYDVYFSGTNQHVESNIVSGKTPKIEQKSSNGKNTISITPVTTDKTAFTNKDILTGIEISIKDSSGKELQKNDIKLYKQNSSYNTYSSKTPELSNLRVGDSVDISFDNIDKNKLLEYGFNISGLDSKKFKITEDNLDHSIVDKFVGNYSSSSDSKLNLNADGCCTYTQEKWTKTDDGKWGFSNGRLIIDNINSFSYNIYADVNINDTNKIYVQANSSNWNPGTFEKKQ